MAAIRPKPTVRPFVVFLASLAIVAHLGTVGLHALEAPSGPWPAPEGMDLAGPPAFAQAWYGRLAQDYLKLVKFTDNYHFPSDHAAAPGVSAEIQLKDAKGEPVATVRLPDPDANSWVRQRQMLLVQQLAPDQPVAPLPGEFVPAPNQEVRRVPIWEPEKPGAPLLRLEQTPEHLIPRGRMVFGPTPWSLVLVRSYARYLCRTHGAASAEVVRHTRLPMPPNAFLNGEPPPDAFNDLIASYGNLAGE
jgi:hypothetical protein